MLNKIFKYSIIAVIVGTILIIATNYSTREYLYKVSEIYKLKKNIEKTTGYNVSLKKRLLNLQTKPKEIEKAVKMELGYIDKDEILYKFNDTDKENIKG